MADSFDPCMPYSVLPLEQVEDLLGEEDYGKIRMIENKDKAKKK